MVGSGLVAGLHWAGVVLVLIRIQVIGVLECGGVVLSQMIGVLECGGGASSEILVCLSRSSILAL